ncbi:MAG: Gldg family protein [Oscillatoria sp. PMC 1051.18]|nr:Gldg family protein [Oscillatoria sp. PMC 1050.18]MEC5030792.1 Gldg family protein [Oscillatoria sp. PMC 1051.18]
MSKKSKYWRYLIWLGPCLLVAGLIAGLVTGEWTVLPIIFLVIGLGIIIFGLITFGGAKKFFARRSTQAGTNAIVATVALVVILGLINFLAVRYTGRIDLTENQLFTLSPQSQEIVKNLEQPLKVWAFVPTPNPADKELLARYSRYGENFEYEFVDPQIEVGIAQRFDVNLIGEIYLEYGDKKQLVQSLSPGEPISEIELTNAIAKVQRDVLPKIYFIQGHGEPLLEAEQGGFSQAVASLEKSGYEVEPLNLASLAAVPEDAGVVAIAGAKRPLIPGEVSAIQTYLDNGGSAFLLIDPNTNPGLDSLLQEWGIVLDNRIVIDASGTGSVLGFGPVTPLVRDYGNHPIVADFANGISIYPLARRIDTNQVVGITATPLIVTSEQSWAESDVESEELEFNPASDVPGPLNLGFAFSRPVSSTPTQTTPPPETEAETPPATDEEITETEAEDLETEETANEAENNPEARLVAIGNSTFATDGWLDEQLNQDLFLNSVDWLSKQDEKSLSIRPKQQENRRINLTPEKAAIIFWSALVVVPLLGLITAGIMWWRRR